MIDPALLRDNPELLAANFARRGVAFDARQYLQQDKQLRELNQSEQQLRAKRNELSRQVGEKMRAGATEDAQRLRSEAGGLGERIKQVKAQVVELQLSLRAANYCLPNLLSAEVPGGRSEEDNVVVRTVGEPAKFDFEARDHVELGKMYEGLDFETAHAMAQARFVVLTGALARLHRALGQFMLDLHVSEHGYRECNVPYLVNTQAMTNTGQLPKFGTDDEFFTAKADDLHLIPTAEVALVNLAAGKTYEADQLPAKYAAHSACFRREAGSYGKDTRGMLRQHQFEKVELVQITHPEHSWPAWEQLVGEAEQVLKRLELPYRAVELCTGDIGHAAARTIDLEVWLPGQQRYREISSCSNDTDYQARRMKAMLRDKPKNRPVHTLNGSGVALGRALIAVLENNQDRYGGVAVPRVLRPYLGGLERLEPPQ